MAIIGKVADSPSRRMVSMEMQSVRLYPLSGRVVQHQPRKKTASVLRNDADVGIAYEAINGQTGLPSKSLIRGAERQEFSKYFVGGDNGLRGQGSGEEHDLRMSAVS